MPFPGYARRSAVQVGLAALSLLILGLVAYSNCLENPLILDDRIVIENDPRIQEGRYFDLLTGEYWPGAHGNLLYRPLTSISLALNWAISQQPEYLRFPNLILHVGVGVLVLLLTMRVTSSLAASVAAGAVFVVHPVHTTVLNSVVDRAEIGAAFFGLLALLLYLRTDRMSQGEESPRGWLSRNMATSLLAAASLAVALLFKENAVTVVGIVLLADVCRLSSSERDPASTRPSQGLPWRVVSSLPMIVVVVAYIFLRSVVLGEIARPAEEIAVVDNIVAHPSHGLQEGDSALLARWGTPLAVFGLASKLLVVGGPLCWDYSYAAIEAVRRVSDPALWFGVMCLVFVIGAASVSFRRRRLVLFSLGFMLISYSVTSNTIVIIGTVFAERYLYLPSVGYCVFLGVVCAAALAGLKAKKKRVLRTVSGIFLLIVGATIFGFAGRTIERNEDFVSETNLNRVDLQTNPRSCRLLAAVAGDLYDAGDFSAAISHADLAIEICPDFGHGWQLSGLSLWRSGRMGEAMPLLETANRLGASDPEQVSVAIADIYKSHGDYRSAIDVLEAHIGRTAPGSAAAARNNLAWYLITAKPLDLRDPLRALPLARQAVKIERGQADYIDTLVSVLIALGRGDEAASTLEELLPTVSLDDPFRGELVMKMQNLRPPQS